MYLMFESTILLFSITEEGYSVDISIPVINNCVHYQTILEFALRNTVSCWINSGRLKNFNVPHEDLLLVNRFIIKQFISVALKILVR